MQIKWKLSQGKYRIKDFRWVFVLIGTAVVILGALYYYGLQLAFYPDSEDLYAIWACYKSIKYGMNYHSYDFVAGFVNYLSTVIGGMSFFALRLSFTLMHTAILICTWYLAMCFGHKNKYNLYILPVFIWFAIALHPATEADPYGWISDYGTDYIYQWPYNYHWTARIYALICLIIAALYVSLESRSKKRVLAVVGAIVTLYAAFEKDLIFYLLFLVPFLIVFGLHTMKGAVGRKWMVYSLSICMLGVLLTKFIPSGISSVLWSTEEAHTYGAIYGATNWLSLNMIWTTIVNYCTNIMGYFTVLLPEAPVISLYTLVYGVKLIILVLGYCIIFRIVKYSINGNAAGLNITVVDEILAWSYAAVSASLILTTYGYNVMYTARYGAGLVTVMSILLCRHLIDFLKAICGINYILRKHEKAFLSFCILVLCLCSMKKVWNFEAHTCHDDDMEAVVEYIKATDLGYTVASWYFAPSFTAMSQGDVIVCNSIKEVKDLYGEDAPISYMVTRYDHAADRYHDYLYYENFEDYEDLCDKYSEPSYVIDYPGFSLCVWEDGLKVLQ